MSRIADILVDLFVQKAKDPWSIGDVIAPSVLFLDLDGVFFVSSNDDSLAQTLGSDWPASLHRCQGKLYLVDHYSMAMDEWPDVARRLVSAGFVLEEITAASISPHNLPAGYVELGFVAIHVAELRQYTADVPRFLRLHSIVARLQAYEPRSDEWRAFVAMNCRTHRDVDDLLLTAKEVGKLQGHLADELDPRVAK